MIISLSKEKSYCLFMTLCLVFANIRIFSDAICERLFGLPMLGEIAFYLIFIIAFICSVSYFVEYIKIRTIVLLLIWDVLCLWMASTTSMDKEIYVGQIIYIVVFSAIYYIAGKSIDKNAEVLYDFLRRHIFVLNIIGLIAMVLSRGNTNNSMELSYANLPAALICTISFLAPSQDGVRYRCSTIFNLLLSYVLVLFGGSRGPLVSIAIVALIVCVYQLFRKRDGRILCVIVAALSFLGIVFIIAYPYIANSSIRVFSLLNTDGLFYASGREHYIEAAILGIRENPLGIGIFKDRVYIYEHFHRYYAENSVGSYPHNLFLEVCMQFGLVIGCIISILLIKGTCRSLIDGAKNGGAKMTLVILGMGFIPLMLSKSYVQYWYFYMFFAYIMNIRKDRGILFLILYNNS